MGTRSRNAYFERMKEKEATENKPIKVAVIIPDRGDRPDFMAHCNRMVENQVRHLPGTIHALSISVDRILVAYPAKSESCDITERYRTAYHSLDGMDFDCVLFMENDDWYHEDYILDMYYEWMNAGKPDLFGIGYTYYYHIGINRYARFDHPRRASMMNTLMKPDLKFEWCPDEYPYTDAWLWNKIENRKTFSPEKPISLGIKHGIGKSGGEYHRTKLERYNLDDTSGEFLSSIVDQDSFLFYNEMSQKAFKP